jgi:hypothetical protein
MENTATRSNYSPETAAVGCCAQEELDEREFTHHSNVIQMNKLQAFHDAIVNKLKKA